MGEAWLSPEHVDAAGSRQMQASVSLNEAGERIGVTLHAGWKNGMNSSVIPLELDWQAARSLRDWLSSQLGE